MNKEIRTVIYDEELHIEAYRFEGIVQPFPNHFHEHYVIGFVESGQRTLSCKNKKYIIGRGNIIIFNPEDNHACEQSGGGSFDYRGLNIGREIMLDLTEEITGKREMTGFSCNVVYDEEIACYLRPLHEMIMNGISGLGKEEYLIFLISALIQKYGQPFENCIPECSEEIERACKFMERNYAEHICLEDICRCAALSKSALLRAFVKTKGVTPYRYLENIRINEAKKLLADGVFPLDAAAQTGFYDQSHFTNYFSRFTGIAPGVYREIFRSGNKNKEGEQNDK